jgi:hypothetical protein
MSKTLTKPHPVPLCVNTTEKAHLPQRNANLTRIDQVRAPKSPPMRALVDFACDGDSQITGRRVFYPRSDLMITPTGQVWTR